MGLEEGIVKFERDVDNILDFLNTFPEDIKKNVLSILDNKDTSKDKALFITSDGTSNNTPNFYICLFSHGSKKEGPELFMLYSTSIEAVCVCTEYMTDLTYQSTREGFGE